MRRPESYAQPFTLSPFSISSPCHFVVTHGLLYSSWPKLEFRIRTSGHSFLINLNYRRPSKTGLASLRSPPPRRLFYLDDYRMSLWHSLSLPPFAYVITKTPVIFQRHLQSSEFSQRSPLQERWDMAKGMVQQKELLSRRGIYLVSLSPRRRSRSSHLQQRRRVPFRTRSFAEANSSFGPSQRRPITLLLRSQRPPRRDGVDPGTPNLQ